MSTAETFANLLILSKIVFLEGAGAQTPVILEPPQRFQRPPNEQNKKAPNPKIRGISPDRIYRKMYLQMNNTARMYIRGVIFLCFPQTRLRIT